MTKTDRTEPESGDRPTANQGAARRTRGIRFSDSEWQEVKTAAQLHDAPAAEFVRKGILDVARGRAGATPASLAPLIERSFRYAYMLVTQKRDELIREGRGEEMEKLGQGCPGTPEPVTGRRLPVGRCDASTASASTRQAPVTSTSPWTRTQTWEHGSGTG